MRRIRTEHALKRTLIGGLALSLLSRLLGADGEIPPALAAASAQATETRKLIMVEFFSYNSVESKMLRDHALGNAEVAAAINEEFVTVAIEQGRDAALEERWHVRKFPTLVIVKPNGTEIDRLAGFRKADEVLALLQRAVAGGSEMDGLIERASSPEAGIDAHLELAAAHVKRANHAAALAEYLWFLDHGATTDPGGFKRQLKSVLARITRLGFDHPAAMGALRDRRDAVEASIDAESAETLLVAFDFNDALKEPQRNVDLYLKIPPGSRARQQLFPAILPQLIETRNYATAVAEVDLESFVNSLYPRQQSGDRSVADFRNALRARTEATQKRRIVDATTWAIEALLATGHPEKARRLAGRALDLDGANEVRQHFVHAALRSGASNATEFAPWLESYGESEADAPVPATLKERAPEIAPKPSPD